MGAQCREEHGLSIDRFVLCFIIRITRLPRARHQPPQTKTVLSQAFIYEPFCSEAKINVVLNGAHYEKSASKKRPTPQVGTRKAYIPAPLQKKIASESRKSSVDKKKVSRVRK